MKAALLCSCLLILACSSTDPEGGGGAGGGGASAGSAGAPAGGSASGSAGMTGGGASAGGTVATAGASGAGTAGAGGATGGSGGAPTAGSAGMTSGGSGGGSGCTPDAAGKLTVMGDVVHDPKTCLDWAKTTTANVNYAAAGMACGDSTLGGFDDWRIPNVNELASIITACGKYAPEGPVDTSVFDIQGDGYWTTTPAEDTLNQEGQPTHLCAIGMANAGGYYHYGPAGPQVVRCVRGTGTVPTVKDCKVADGCKNW